MYNLYRTNERKPPRQQNNAPFTRETARSARKRT